MKYHTLIVCLISFASFVSAKYPPQPCLDCPEELTGSMKLRLKLMEVENILNASLNKLAAGDGPYYRLEKVNSASTEAGTFYNINAVLEDNTENKKTCDVSITSRPWLSNGTTISFMCPGENRITKTIDL